MKTLNAKFIKSSTKPSECPNTGLPELAFIGRSNVGKSSLINMIAGRKSLAKTSVTPGKTQLINHFLIEDTWYLVDLPGYGYAKVSKSRRKSFDRIIEGYLLNRESLRCVFVLIDSRIPPQNLDLAFMEFLGTNQVPFVIVFTKTEANTKSKLAASLENFRNEMLINWEEIPSVFLTSSRTGKGREELLEYMEAVVKSN
jgi:GTP-binding protein